MTEVVIEQQMDKAHDGGEGETGLSKEDEHAMEELLQESKQDSTPRLQESKQERLQESKRESPNVVCNGKTDDVRGRFLSIENRIDKQATELNSVKETLKQLVDQQRITNELLAQLSTKQSPQDFSPQLSINSPPQYNSNATAKSTAAQSTGSSGSRSPSNRQNSQNAEIQPMKPEPPAPLPSVAAPAKADIVTPTGAQPILNIVPGSVNDSDALNAALPALNEPARDEPGEVDGGVFVESNGAPSSQPLQGDSLEIPEIPFAPRKSGKQRWKGVQGLVKKPNSKDDLNRAATDGDLDAYKSSKSEGDQPRTGAKANSFSLKLQAISALTVPSQKEKLKKQKVKPGGVSRASLERQKELQKELQATTPQFVIFLQTVVASDRFAYFFGILIMANSVAIGLQADHVAGHLHSDPPAAFAGLETFFCWAFLAEIVMKIIAEGKQFLISEGWKWNIFDCIIVLLALIEEISKMVSAGGGATVNLTFVRILRILRIVRIIRLIRVLKVFRELRVLINSIMGSLKSLCWTILLLIIIMYVVGVYVTQVVAEHRRKYGVPDAVLLDEEHPDDLVEMEKMFGSIALTLYSLYKAMSGGADWGDVSHPLEKRIHWLFGPFFCMYIAFAVFAVLNVVTGVFVNEAMVMAGKDQELVIEEELSRTGSDVNEFIRMFHEADADGSGTVSWEEFKGHMEDDRVKAYFKVLDLNIDEAEQLFMLLDPLKLGEVAIDDFVKGCVRMKGGAKSVDVQTLLAYQKQMMSDMDNLNLRLDALHKGLGENKGRRGGALI